MKKHNAPADPVRRDVLKKAVFVAPVILTLPAIPSFAKDGSNNKEENNLPIKLPVEIPPVEKLPASPLK